MFTLGRRRFAISFTAIIAGLVALNLGLRLTHTHWFLLAWYWPVALAAVVVLVAARLKDTGHSPWWAVTCLVPFIALGLGVWLCFAPAAARTWED